MLFLPFLCLDSPAKLAVTALPRSSAGEGEVLVDTARGGVSQSSMVFMYMEKVISISSHSKSLEAAKKQQEGEWEGFQGGRGLGG